MQIVPAILENNLDEVAKKLAIIQEDGNFKIAQIDITDGQLVENLTVTPMDLADLDFGDLKIDWHLMTEEPLDYVWEIAAQETKLPTRAVFGQIERMSDQNAFLKAARERGFTAGLALDLDTPIDSITEAAWSEIEEILLLTVPMGKQGQNFIPTIWEKVEELRTEIKARGLKIKIGLDGGIRPDQLKKIKEEQIDQAVIGSFLWQGTFGTQAEIVETVSEEK